MRSAYLMDGLQISGTRIGDEEMHLGLSVPFESEAIVLPRSTTSRLLHARCARVIRHDVWHWQDRRIRVWLAIGQNTEAFENVQDRPEGNACLRKCAGNAYAESRMQHEKTDDSDCELAWRGVHDRPSQLNYWVRTYVTVFSSSLFIPRKTPKKEKST